MNFLGSDHYENQEDLSGCCAISSLWAHVLGPRCRVSAIMLPAYLDNCVPLWQS